MSRTLATTGVAVAACALLGSLASREVGSPWYRALRKLAIQPPPVAFALAPYAAWCTFATVLSAALWRVNRG